MNAWKLIPSLDLTLKDGKFNLSSAILYVSAEGATGLHAAHDLACVKRGNRGYIVDSNRPYKMWPCEWWIGDKLQDFLKTSKMFNVYNQFKNGKINVFGFEFLVYTNSTYTDKISPSCKKVGKVVGKPAFKQAQIMRMLENIVNKATSKFDAMNKFNALKNAGYFDDGNRPTFIHFLNKKQFPKSQMNENKNKKGRPILKGPKGGLYVIGPNGKKIYKKLVPSTGINTKGRNVKTGQRGGHYVLSKKGTKMYKFFH